jgi:hypothetical protein
MIKATDLQKQLECSICLKTFNNIDHKPKILSCGHTICEITITKLYKNNTIKCPLCRVVNFYENIDTLPLNHMIISIMNFNDEYCDENFKKALKEVKKIDKLIEFSVK